jgi:CheY-like chemotaxis protein
MKEHRHKTAHILVAEDDTTDVFFLQRAFKRAGIPLTLQFVEDGQEVLDYLQGRGRFTDRSEHPFPELLLLDLHMPRRDGFEVLSWIQKQPALEDLQVVIFTSSTEKRDIERARDLGANSYLVKPHSIQELIEFVAAFKKHWLAAA